MCYQIAVGKDATADGSVLVARSADSVKASTTRIISVPRRIHKPGETIRIPSHAFASSSNREKVKTTSMVEVPQVPETFAYVAIAEFSEKESLELVGGGINEFQVSLGSSSGFHPLKEKVKRLSPRSKSSVGDYRMTITLQRARTAREAVEIMADLTEEYGARLDNYMVADPNEVWMWEEFQGHRWVAVRVPDDCFVVEANNCRITNIDLDDPKNYMGSKDVIDFAVEHGLYDPSSGEPFSCVKAYSDRGEVRYGIPAPKYNTRRVWRGISLLAPSTKLDPEDDYFPLFVKPDNKLTPKDLLNVMRDHYQGTPYDLHAADQDEYKYSEMYINKKRQYQLSPSWNTERPIGISRSRLNWVAQLRGWLPNPIGGVLWGGIAAAWANGHVPWYAGITKTPEPYNVGTNDKIGQGKYEDDSAYWVYETVASLVNLFWRNTIDDVQPIWEEWENKLYKLQPAVEKAALELYEKNPDIAVKFLTSYSCSKGVEALEIAKAMIPKLITTIASKNTGI